MTNQMASANVELVRSIYDAWARGDFSSTEWAHPEIEYVNPEDAVEPGTRHGVDEFTSAIQRVFDGWASWKMMPERFESVADQVAVVVRYAARGRSSGVVVEGRESALWTLRDGRVARYAWFHDPDDALNAVGIAAEPDQRVVEDNVDLLRRGWDVISRGDLEEAIRLSADDVVIIAQRSAVEGAYVGHSGVRDFLADNAKNFTKFELTLDEGRDLGDGRVLAIGTVRIRGRGGGVETDIPTAGIATFRDGRLSRWEDFRDRELALKAAGLSS